MPTCLDTTRASGSPWGARRHAGSGVFTICAVFTGLNCEEDREQSHTPDDDVAKGLNRQRREPPTPAPHQRSDPPTPAPRQRREPPTPAPRQRPTPPNATGKGAHNEETPDERPVPPPRRRRAPPKETPDERPIPRRRRMVFRRTRWVIGSFLRGWQMDVPQRHPHGADPRAFLEEVRPQIRAKLEKEIKTLNSIKFQLALKVQLRKYHQDGSEYTTPVLRHKQETILQSSEIEEALDQAFPSIQETLEKWTQRGSGWFVDRVEVLWLDIARYQPLRGNSYIPLPAALRSKKAVINVKNKDNHCFRWALRSLLFPVDKDPQRPSKYPQQDDLEFAGIDSLTPISQIPRLSGKTTWPSTSLGGIRG